jgi:hypothetical protein
MIRVPDMRRRAPEPPPAGPPDIQVKPGPAPGQVAVRVDHRGQVGIGVDHPGGRADPVLADQRRIADEPGDLPGDLAHLDQLSRVVVHPVPEVEDGRPHGHAGFLGGEDEPSAVKAGSRFASPVVLAAGRQPAMRRTSGMHMVPPSPSGGRTPSERRVPARAARTNLLRGAARLGGNTQQRHRGVPRRRH